MIEYAILEHGEIINVVTTDAGRASAERVAEQMGDDLTVVPLDSLPLDVKRRYEFWEQRP